MISAITWRRAIYMLYVLAAVAVLLYTIGAPATEGH
jgi:hypothetical protein